MPVEYRTATPADAPQIALLAKAIWTAHYTPIIGEAQVAYMLTHFQDEATIRKQIEDGVVYTLAFQDGIPAGYSAYKKEPDRIFLSKVYVKEEYRGIGIAKEFLQLVISAAAEESTIYLTVNKHNKVSVAVYEKMGFVTIDSIATDIGGGFVMDDYIMEKHFNRC